MEEFRAVWLAALGILTTACGAEPDTVAALKARIELLERELAEARAILVDLQVDQAPPVEVAIEPQPSPVSMDTAAVYLPDSPQAEQVSPGHESTLPSFLREWKSSVEFGLNGSEGNASRQSLRLALNTARRTDAHESVLKGAYRLASDNGQRRQNQLILDARQDWLAAKDGKWRYFTTARYELDEFQNWDARLSGFGGVGYQIVRTEKTSLLSRGGFGGSRRFGSDDDDFRTEGFVAADLSHTLSASRTLRAAVEYLPDTTDWGEFRLNSDASLEVRIDPASDLYLRIGIANRFDSNPGKSAHESDIDYFVNLGWSF